MKIGAEAIEQIKVIEWIKQCTDIPVIHIANERQSSVQYGSILKRMGVMPGVADLFFPRGTGNIPGMWIEMKSAKGKVSPLQAKFLCQMVNEGYVCYICYSAEEAIMRIKAFYSI